MPRKAKTVGDMLQGLLGKGWSKKQIEHRTGMSVRAQTDALAGRRPGAKYADAVRSAARAGGGRPPAPGRPVAPVKGAGAGGTVELPGDRSVTEAKPTTDPAWLRQQIERAGDKKISFAISGKNVRRYSGPVQREGEFELFGKGGWSARSFLHAVDNPTPDDGWRKGDIFGALRGMSMRSAGVDRIDKVTGVRFES